MFFIKIQIVVNYLPDFIKIYVNKYSIFREENTFDLSCVFFVTLSPRETRLMHLRQWVCHLIVITVPTTLFPMGNPINTLFY